jgi:hypothetical protein
MANLFAKAKTSAPAKTAKENEKQEFLFKMLHFSIESKTRIFTRLKKR